MTRLIFTSTIIFFSCRSDSTKNVGSNIIDTTQAIKSTEIIPVQSDTLRDPTHYYYLTDLPLSQVSQLILADSIQPLDNKIIFDCMDSLSSKDKSVRDLYFPVFLKILDKSDGALAEAIGQYAMTFIEKYPGEFAIRSKSITDNQLKSIASITGYELYFTYETAQKAKSWTNSMIKKCISCDSSQLNRLEEFNKLAIDAMKDVEEN